MVIKMEETKEMLELEKKNHKLNDKNRKVENKEEHKKEKAQRKENKSILLEPKRKLKIEKKERVRKLNEPPRRPILEEIGNAITHGVGAILAIIAFILLILKSDTGLKITASVVYGFSMFFMMLMSCLYHSFKGGSKVKRLWRRFDYTSIYLLIGGTFAPIYLVYWGNILGIVLFIIQWLLISLGITFVCSQFPPGRQRIESFQTPQ